VVVISNEGRKNLSLESFQLSGVFKFKFRGTDMSINRIVILVVVAGYVVVNVLMQIDFFAGRNIFAKYKETATAVDALRVGEEAYFAKTGFLLILLVLSALSLSAYVIMMLVFFGINLSTALHLPLNSLRSPPAGGA
jgi:hypothetical protein